MTNYEQFYTSYYSENYIVCYCSMLQGKISGEAIKRL